MGIMSKLFGSDKVLSAGISAIDKAFYTKEEQADDGLKKIGFKMQFMKLYEPFKVAQRFIALVTGIPFVVTHVLISIAWASSLFVIEDKERYTFVVSELFKIAQMNNVTLGEPFGWIIIFYFAGGAGEGLIGKFMNRNQNKKV